MIGYISHQERQRSAYAHNKNCQFDGAGLTAVSVIAIDFLFCLNSDMESCCWIPADSDQGRHHAQSEFLRLFADFRLSPVGGGCKMQTNQCFRARSYLTLILTLTDMYETMSM